MSKTIHLSLDNDDDGDNDAHDVVLMIIMIKLVTMIPHAPNIFLMLMFMIMLPLKFMWCPLSRFDCGWPRQQSPGRAQTWVIANRRDLKRPTNTLTSDASLPPPRSLSSTSTIIVWRTCIYSNIFEYFLIQIFVRTLFVSDSRCINISCFKAACKQVLRFFFWTFLKDSTVSKK